MLCVAIEPAAPLAAIIPSLGMRADGWTYDDWSFLLHKMAGSDDG